MHEQNDWDRVLQKLVYTFNQHPISIVRIYEFRNQGVGKGIIPLSLISNVSLGEFLLSVPATLIFTSLEVLVPGVRAPARHHNKHSIDLKAQIFPSPSHFEPMMLLSQQTKKGITG